MHARIKIFITYISSFEIDIKVYSSYYVSIIIGDVSEIEFCSCIYHS